MKVVEEMGIRATIGVTIADNLMTEEGLIEQRDEEEDLFERIVERKPEKPKQAAKTEPDNVFLRRKEAKQRRARTKQELQRIERLIEQNETAKKEAEQELTRAQTENDFRQMQELYEKLSSLETQETELYEQLEKAEATLTEIKTEDEI